MPPANPASQTRIYASLAGSLAISVLGILCASFYESQGWPDPTTHPFANIYYYLFASFEPAMLGLYGVAALAGILLLSKNYSGIRWQAAMGHVRPRAWFWSLAVAGFCTLGAYFIYLQHPFSMDEYGAHFQALLFSRGQLTASIPLEWAPAGAAITPIFISRLGDPPAWSATYLPMFSALKAPFVLAHIEPIFAPVAAGLSVVAFHRVLTSKFPGELGSQCAGLILLICSPQFLIYGMSYYSMPAHLLFSVVWLLLYVKDTRASLALLPVVGGLALGLHQPQVHAIFAAPFLARFVWSRRWGVAAWQIVIYLSFIALWILYRRITLPGAAPDMGATTMFGFPNIGLQAVLQSANLSMIQSWSHLALIPFVLLGLSRFRQWESFRIDCLLSCALSFGFYMFFLADQGHGWGHRYFYGTFPSLVLLGVYGYRELVRTPHAPFGDTMLLGGAFLSLLLAVPYRCYEVEKTIRPFVETQRLIEEMDANVVAIPILSAWYVQDLVRNDPFFEGKQILCFPSHLPLDGSFQFPPETRFEIIDAELLHKGGLPTYMDMTPEQWQTLLTGSMPRYRQPRTPPSGASIKPDASPKETATPH